MIERPAIFSTAMVVSLLKGTKTKTRRLQGLELINGSETPMKPYNGDCHIDKKGRLNQKFFNGYYSKHGVCPYGKAGDLLYVRETFKPVSHYARDYEFVQYKADGLTNDNNSAEFLHELLDGADWRPCIHMPKKVARIWLQITDISYELLTSISEDDAIAEGILANVMNPMMYCNYEKVGYRWLSAIESFKSLWQSINKDKYPWSSNPWVWVVTFKVVSTTGRENIPKNILDEHTADSCTS